MNELNVVCKGKNCNATNATEHSQECIADHEASVFAIDVNECIHNLKLRFASGNDNQVSSCVVTREEIMPLFGELKESKLQHGLLQISYDHKSTLLDSCESALAKRDERIKSQQQALDTLKRERDEYKSSYEQVRANYDAIMSNIK